LLIGVALVLTLYPGAGKAADEVVVAHPDDRVSRSS
jgi:hypothetical protein